MSGILQSRIQLRRATAAQWIVSNTVLALGEPAVETDTGKFKVGDGETSWNGLSYFADEEEFLNLVRDLGPEGGPFIFIGTDIVMLDTLLSAILSSIAIMDKAISDNIWSDPPDDWYDTVLHNSLLGRDVSITHPADTISLDTSENNLDATQVQTAIDILSSKKGVTIAQFLFKEEDASSFGLTVTPGSTISGIPPSISWNLDGGIIICKHTVGTYGVYVINGTIATYDGHFFDNVGQKILEYSESETNTRSILNVYIDASDPFNGHTGNSYIIISPIPGYFELKTLVMSNKHDANIVIAVSSVDGSATTFHVIIPSSETMASDPIPAGWTSIIGELPISLLSGGMSVAIPGDGSVGASPGVYKIPLGGSLSGKWAKAALYTGEVISGVVVGVGPTVDDPGVLLRASNRSGPSSTVSPLSLPTRLDLITNNYESGSSTVINVTNDDTVRTGLSLLKDTQAGFYDKKTVRFLDPISPDNSWKTDDIVEPTNGLDILTILNPMYPGSDGVFSEVLTRTADEGAGSWDCFESAIFWGNGEDEDVNGVPTIPGKPYAFFEITRSGASAEADLRPIVDLDLCSGIMCGIRWTIDFTTNELSIYKLVNQGGDSFVGSSRWEKVYSVIDSDFDSLHYTESPIEIGRNYCGDIYSLLLFDGPGGDLLASFDPSTWPVTSLTSNEDSVGNLWYVGSGSGHIAYASYNQAQAIRVNSEAFSGILSSTDTDVQKALLTIDSFEADGSSFIFNPIKKGHAGYPTPCSPGSTGVGSTNVSKGDLILTQSLPLQGLVDYVVVYPTSSGSIGDSLYVVFYGCGSDGWPTGVPILEKQVITGNTSSVIEQAITPVEFPEVPVWVGILNVGSNITSSITYQAVPASSFPGVIRSVSGTSTAIKATNQGNSPPDVTGYSVGSSSGSTTWGVNVVNTPLVSVR